MSKLIKHLKKNRKRYLIADVAILENPLLSWKAKGLLLYLLNRPDKWIANERDLINRSTDGIWSVHAAQKELKEAGHLEIKKFNGSDWEWRVYEVSNRKPIYRKPTPISNTDSNNNIYDDYYDKIKERTRKEIGL